MYFPLLMEVLCFLFFFVCITCVHSNFAIILKRKRKLVALLLLPYRCRVSVNVLWLFLTVLWVGLQCKIGVFPDHTLMDDRRRKTHNAQRPITIAHLKAKKVAKIRNWYNQVPHQTQVTTRESDKNSIKHYKQEPRGQPLPSR